MARRRDENFPTDYDDGAQSDDTDLVGAEPRLSDDVWSDDAWLDYDSDEEELSDEEDEDDVLIIEVELFDDDEMLDTEA